MTNDSALATAALTPPTPASRFSLVRSVPTNAGGAGLSLRNGGLQLLGKVAGLHLPQDKPDDHPPTTNATALLTRIVWRRMAVRRAISDSSNAERLRKEAVASSGMGRVNSVNERQTFVQCLVVITQLGSFNIPGRSVLFSLCCTR